MSNSDKFRNYQPIIFAFLFVIGMLFGAVLMNIRFSSKSSLKESIFNFSFNKYDKLNDVINYISDNYVDSVNKETLINDAINGLLGKLDPHSAYISANELKQMNESLQGNFEGIGVEFRIEKDTVIVLNTISGGPSEKVGIKAGDRIIKVNDTLVAGVKIKNQEIVKKLKGPKNTEVKVSILRRNISELINFKIIRDVIPTYSVDIAYMVDKEIGFIMLNRFGATTYDEFIEAVNNLKFKGMKKLIVDLRGNGGGYLNAAINIANEFLEKKQLIVYTEGRNRPKTYEYATSSGSLKNTPFVLLIDEWSASASEVLAGALQDNDKGVVIGKRSFGKGLVQEQTELMDGSALRLTVARYYTPSGRSIQRPYSDNSDEYYMNFYKRFLDESDSSDTLSKHAVKYYTPKGKIVYGGGGITPDIIVNYNPNKYSKYFNQLSDKSLIYEFSFEYSDILRDSLKNIYKNAKDFNAKFIITQKVFNDFIGYAVKKGVKEDKNEKINSEFLIKIMLKAYIGRNLFSNEAFYPTIHKIDDTFLKAIEVLKDSKLYNSY